MCGCVGVWVCGCVGVWVCGCVGAWVCGCVCVCETFVPKRIKAGGQCMPDSHCPTKTLSVHGDIWPDQPDVPATVCMERRQVRFCKSNYLRRCNENCVLGRCPPHLSELRSVEP